MSRHLFFTGELENLEGGGRHDGRCRRVLRVVGIGWGVEVGVGHVVFGKVFVEVPDS